MSKESSIIKNASMATLLFAGAIGADMYLGDVMSTQLIFNIFSGVSANLLDKLDKNSIRSIFGRRKHPNELNHDVQRMTISALKLTIKSVGMLYKEEVIKQGDDLTLMGRKEKYLDKNITTLCQLINNTDVTQLINSKELIEYVEELRSKETDNLFHEFFSIKDYEDIDEVDEAVPFLPFLEKRFFENFKLCFGELLKKDNFRPALVAYQREIQKMILNLITDKNDLPGDVIAVIREEMGNWSKYLDKQEISPTFYKELTDQLTEKENKLAQLIETQKYFLNEIKQLSSYFQTKKIFIREIRRDTILIEDTQSDIREIENNYSCLMENFVDLYYFEYKGKLYPVCELNQESFNYLTGKAKPNQLLIKKIINKIKDVCKGDEYYFDFIRKHEETWDSNQTYIKYGQNIISNKFAGIIGKLLDKLYSIGMEMEKADDYSYKTKYLEHANYIARKLLDLVVYALLSQLWDELQSNSMNLSDKNKKNISAVFNLEPGVEELFTIIQDVNKLYANKPTIHSMILLPELLNLDREFNRGSQLYNSYGTLTELIQHKDLNNLDCFIAEISLSYILEQFSFFAELQYDFDEKNRMSKY